MESFSSITATAVPFLRQNVDTDVIIPIQRLVGTGRTGLGPYAFERLRYLPDGSDNPQFPLNQPGYKGSQLLLADENFGCGSSREGAVVAVQRLHLIRALLALRSRQRAGGRLRQQHCVLLGLCGGAARSRLLHCSLGIALCR